MNPSVAAGHLDDFDARSADLLQNHVSASTHWKMLDELLGANFNLLRPVGETILVGGMLWTRTGLDWLVLWAGATLVAIAARVVLCAAYRASPDRTGIEAWRGRLVACAWASGALWGALGSLILLSSDPVVHVVVAVALGNKLCEAVTGDSSEPRAGLGQVLLMLLPLAVCCFVKAEPVYVGCGALTIVQIAASSLRVRHLHRQTTGLLNATATVEKANSQLTQLNRKLSSLATTDALTRLNNRAGFDAALRREWGRAIREHRPLTVMLLQIDHFAAFNEACGSAEGDECLRRVADALQLTLRRTTDLPARYGVDEFAVVLPDTDRVASHYLGERICAAIATLGLAHSEFGANRISVSVGHATVIPAEVLVPSHLVSQADTALRRAKATGKGCACAWDEALDNANSTALTASAPSPLLVTKPATDAKTTIRRLLPRVSDPKSDGRVPEQAGDVQATSEPEP